MKRDFFNGLKVDEDGNLYYRGKIVNATNRVMDVRFNKDPSQITGPFKPFLENPDVQGGTWSVFRFPDSSATGYLDALLVSYGAAATDYQYLLVAPTEDAKQWMVHIWEDGEISWGATVSDLSDDIEADVWIIAQMSPRWSALPERFRKTWMLFMGGKGEPHATASGDGFWGSLTDGNAWAEGLETGLPKWVNPEGGTFTGDIVGVAEEAASTVGASAKKLVQGIGDIGDVLPVIAGALGLGFVALLVIRSVPHRVKTS